MEKETKEKTKISKKKEPVSLELRLERNRKMQEEILKKILSLKIHFKGLIKSESELRKELERVSSSSDSENIKAEIDALREELIKDFQE
jgi:hypothetical protein